MGPCGTVFDHGSMPVEILGAVSELSSNGPVASIGEKLKKKFVTRIEFIIDCSSDYENRKWRTGTPESRRDKHRPTGFWSCSDILTENT